MSNITVAQRWGQVLAQRRDCQQEHQPRVDCMEALRGDRLYTHKLLCSPPSRVTRTVAPTYTGRFRLAFRTDGTVHSMEWCIRLGKYLGILFFTMVPCPIPKLYASIGEIQVPSQYATQYLAMLSTTSILHLTFQYAKYNPEKKNIYM